MSVGLVGYLTLNGQPLLPNAEDYELVFQDEFSGTELDWTIWESAEEISTSSSGETVGRWAENAIVEDGQLKLVVKKANRADSEWTAGFVWLRQTFGPNTYYEARFKCTDAPGVNNAFWTACKTTMDMDSKDYRNRYEIDVVEAKRLNGQDALTGHLAWHDWKTYSYTDGVDIAQGIVKTYPTIDYQTWGLWVGENTMIIYCDGVEQWRGTTHDKYPNQWKTGIGKLPQWYSQEEKRAYGKYGQDDWSYMGGMNGDDMNLCLSTMPWSAGNSTLTDKAHNTSMDIDYVRVYKLKRDLSENVVQQQEYIGVDTKVEIQSPWDFDVSHNYYFSVLLERADRENSAVSLYDSGGGLFARLTIAENGNLILSNNIGAVATTETAYPATISEYSYVEQNKKFLLVGRITASVSEKDILSFSLFELGHDIPKREPFLYRNIDDSGNTSITNEWMINIKSDFSGVVDYLDFVGAKTSFSDLLIANNYWAVVAPYADNPTAFLYGEDKSNTSKRIYIQTTGDLPFQVVYSDGVEQKKIVVDSQPFSVQVKPGITTTYQLVSACDAEGNEAIIGGNAVFYVRDDDEYQVFLPVYDTYTIADLNENHATEADIWVSNDLTNYRVGYFSFEIMDGAEITSDACLNVYLTSKAPADACKIALYVSDIAINDRTDWNNIPDDWELLMYKTLGTTSGYYMNFDISECYNRYVKGHKRNLTFKIVAIGADGNVSIKLKPGHNITTSVPTMLYVKKQGGSSLGGSLLFDAISHNYDNVSRILTVAAMDEIDSLALMDLNGRIVATSNVNMIYVPVGCNGLFLLKINTKGKEQYQKIMLH